MRSLIVLNTLAGLRHDQYSAVRLVTTEEKEGGGCMRGSSLLGLLSSVRYVEIHLVINRLYEPWSLSLCWDCPGLLSHSGEY
jgi:hypothetical protein